MGFGLFFAWCGRRVARLLPQLRDGVDGDQLNDLANGFPE